MARTVVITATCLAVAACTSTRLTTFAAMPADAGECRVVAQALKLYSDRVEEAEVSSLALPRDWIDGASSLPTSTVSEFRDVGACSDVVALADQGAITLLPITAPATVGLSDQSYVSPPPGPLLSRPTFGGDGRTAEVVVNPICDPSWIIRLQRTSSGWVGTAERNDDEIKLCHEIRR